MERDEQRLARLRRVAQAAEALRQGPDDWYDSRYMDRTLWAIYDALDALQDGDLDQAPVEDEA